MKSFEKMSIDELGRHIRNAAKDTSKIIITDHAKLRMKQRKVVYQEVVHCMREGRLLNPAEPGKNGNLVCSMNCYGSSRNIQVCVALSDEDPNLIVVTVIDKS